MSYVFEGFARTDGRLLARFRGRAATDVRVVALDGLGFPQSELEVMPDRLRSELTSRAYELAALARTARVVWEHDDSRRDSTVRDQLLE